MSPKYREAGHGERKRARDGWATRYLAVPLAVMQLATIVAEIVVSFAFTPRYSWVSNTISELGVKACTRDFDPREGVEACSPWGAVMNGTMVLSGLCLMLLVIVLRRSRGFRNLAGVLWAVAGAGSVAAGLITLDVSPTLHQFASMPLFFGGPLATMVGAFQLSGRLRATGVCLGAFTLLLGVLFSTTDLVYGFGGIVERLVIWPTLGWVLLISVLARKEACLLQPETQVGEDGERKASTTHES